MNLAYVRALWDELRLVHGITIRAVEALPTDALDAHPIPNMRTPKQLVTHMAETLRGLATGAIQGTVADFEAGEREKAAAIRTRDDLVASVAAAWADADQAIRSMTEAQAVSKVQTPWNYEPPGWVCVQIIFDEMLHHRGQLFVYLRALGAEPPSMWDFAHSAPEFRPKPKLQPA